MSLSIGELLDTIKSQLDNDPLVSAAVSSVISPEGRSLLAGVVGSLADLEAKHESDKQAAVAAKEAEVRAEVAAAPPAEG
jgi:hypothetical protein